MADNLLMGQTNDISIYCQFILFIQLYLKQLYPIIFKSDLFRKSIVIMSKNLSDNTPLKSSDKKSIQRLPLDDRFITPTFDAVGPRLGKYISQDDQCIILHQVH